MNFGWLRAGISSFGDPPKRIASLGIAESVRSKPFFSKPKAFTWANAPQNMSQIVPDLPSPGRAFDFMLGWKRIHMMEKFPTEKRRMVLEMPIGLSRKVRFSMRRISVRFIRCLIFFLAGYTHYLLVGSACVFGADPKSTVVTTMKVDHILLEVSNLTASLAFYRDFLGLRLKSRSEDFVMLESDNVGIFLWSGRWDWEESRSSGERQGLGMYPHLDVSDVAAIVDRARQAGYRIVQEQRIYDWAAKRSSPTQTATPGHSYLFQSKILASH